MIKFEPKSKSLECGSHHCEGDRKCWSSLLWLGSACTGPCFVTSPSQFQFYRPPKLQVSYRKQWQKEKELPGKECKRTGRAWGGKGMKGREQKERAAESRETLGLCPSAHVTQACQLCIEPLDKPSPLLHRLTLAMDLGLDSDGFSIRKPVWHVQEKNKLEVGISQGITVVDTLLLPSTSTGRKNVFYICVLKSTSFLQKI